MRVFLYLIDFFVANVWHLYKVAHKKAYPKKKFLALYEFKRAVSLCWMSQNKRPGKRRIFTHKASKVPLSLRLENKKHLPKCKSGFHGRKRCEDCKMFTNVYCSKCNAHLCLSHRRNCYYKFHGGSDSECLDSDPENVDSNHSYSNHASDADSESNSVFGDTDIGEQQPGNNAPAIETHEI